MALYEVTRKRIQRANGDTYQKGDVFEPTESEISAFRDRLSRVEEPSEAAESVEGEEDDESPSSASDLVQQASEALQRADTNAPD